MIIRKSGIKQTLSPKKLLIHIDDLKGNAEATIVFEIIVRAFQSVQIAKK